MKRILTFILFALLLLPLEGQIGRYPFYTSSGPRTYATVLNDGNHYWFIGDEGVTLDEADSVVSWQSQGKSLTISAPYPTTILTKKPRQIGDSIVFNGSNVLFNNTPVSQPIMVYMVVNQLATPVGWEDENRFLGGETSYLKQNSSSPKIALYAGASSTTIDGPAIGVKGIIRVLFKDNDGFIKINDNTVWTGDTGANGWDHVHIGNNVINNDLTGINAAFWEIVIGPEDSDADETLIYNYLKSKYGL